MTQGSDQPQLNNETIAFLLSILRNASSPVTTADLVEALKNSSAK